MGDFLMIVKKQEKGKINNTMLLKLKFFNLTMKCINLTKNIDVTNYKNNPNINRDKFI